jgi:mono/diheme cytochrome c family protein
MRALMIAAALLVALPAAAQEDKIALKAGTGKDLVENSCAACHSLDYVQMNSPFLDRPKWEATVKKMIGAFGASVDEKDVPGIVDYLAKNYGG